MTQMLTDIKVRAIERGFSGTLEDPRHWFAILDILTQGSFWERKSRSLLVTSEVPDFFLAGAA